MAGPQYFTETKGYEFRYKYNMPVAFAERICACEGLTVKFSEHGGFCARCIKPFEWTLFECVRCETLFIKDFGHPYFCICDPTCWECSQKLDNFCPTEFHMGVAKQGGYIEALRDPLGLNPKTFTDEELADVFDF